MQSLGRVLAASGPAAHDDYWYTPKSYPGTTGMPVTADSAMTIPAFYAAVAYVSEDVAKLPLNMFEDLGDDPATGRSLGSRKASDHELAERLHNQPNRHQGSLVWREFNTAVAMLRGRCVNEIVSGDPISYPGRPTRSSPIDQIVPLHPDLVRREPLKAGGWKYLYRDPKSGYAERPLLREDLFIVPGRQDRSVLDFAATNLGHIIGAERLQGFMFSRGAKHQGVVMHPKLLPDRVRTNLRKALDEYSIDGPRAGRPLLLEDGMTWKDVSMTAVEAQALETNMFSVTQVCRWIRVQPHKVFALEGTSNASIAVQLSIDYVVDSLLGWLKRWEQAIWIDLVHDKRYFAKHLVDGLLQGEPEARGKMYALAIMWGWMTRNEVREREDLNPIEGLDEPLTPGNMTVGADGVPRALPENSQQVGGGTARLAASLGGQDVALLRVYASDAAARVVRRDIAAMTTLARRTAGDAEAWRAGVDAHYADHVERIASELHIPEYVARREAATARAVLVADGPAAMADWLTERVEALTDLAMEQPELRRAA